jgi:hypothetical protein
VCGSTLQECLEAKGVVEAEREITECHFVAVAPPGAIFPLE